jgi:hypothetical protein
MISRQIAATSAAVMTGRIYVIDMIPLPREKPPVSRRRSERPIRFLFIRLRYPAF